jgi:PTS system fructose-specific IIC component
MQSNYLKISEVIEPATVDLTMDGIQKKEEAIDFLADLLDKAGHLSNKAEYIQSVYEREKTGPHVYGEFHRNPARKKRRGD